MDKKEIKVTGLAESVKSDAPQYPYGLKLNIDKDAMNKLGMKEMPKMGNVMNMRAKCKVTNMSANEHGKHMGLQITDMEIMPDGSSTSDDDWHEEYKRSKTKKMRHE